MESRVALLRGINVGRAKRVAMQDLRDLMTQLGYSDVRTLLNSGNVLFKSSRETKQRSAERIEQGIAERLGLSVRVLVRSAADLAEVVEGNPLRGIADAPSRLLVAFVVSTKELARLKPLMAKDWGKEALAIGPQAAYIWCPDGIHKSGLVESVGQLLSNGTTMRNWGTLTKLHSILTGM